MKGNGHIMASVTISCQNKDLENTLQEISSKEAWNPPEDALSYNTFTFKIAHVDESKSTFFGKISASHVGDHAKADIMAEFEKV